MRLFTYKMTHDTGFAPNPFHGVLTLATCKPGMRRTKKIGDWIAGFSSEALASSKGVTVDCEALIYLGRVSKRLTIAEYYEQYKNKIPPSIEADDLINRAGDNIYEPLCTDPEKEDDYYQIRNINHDDGNKSHDLSVQNVLIFDESYYLGSNGKRIPGEINISRPTGPTPYGYKTVKESEINKLIKWVRKQYKKEIKGMKGIYGMPCMWDEDNKKPGSCG